MRYTIPNAIAFNITATCNLNCNGCFIGSNFEYYGHTSWKQQQPIYEKWSQKVDIKAFEISGGEPFLNPEWYDWFTGIGKLWPNACGWVCTNGYAISAEKNQKLYDTLKKSNGRFWLEITHHNAKKYDWMIEQLHKFLDSGIVKSRVSVIEYWANRGLVYDQWIWDPLCLKDLKGSYNDVKDVSWPEVNTLEDWHGLPDWIKRECDEEFDISIKKVEERNMWNYMVSKYTDRNGVSVFVREGGDEFFEGVLSIHDHDLSFQDSDRQRAYDACGNKWCLEFYNGSIHQCSSAGHFKEWSEQLPIELTEKQKQLISSYTPLTAESTVEEIAHWFELDRWQSMPQCVLCPEERKSLKIEATTKKIRFIKK